MIVTTTPSVDGQRITRYHSIVAGDAILEVDLDYEVINNMLMVSASGTAVTLG
jgi:uncharacterized protein YbjQ (UPF0145 family)